MLGVEIVSDLYFENHDSYFHEIWYKYKTLSDYAEKKM